MKKYMWMAALIACMFVLVSCGPDPIIETPPPPDEQQEENPDPRPDPGPLTVWHYGEAEAFLTEFTASYEMLEVELVAFESVDALVAELEAGGMPDVFLAPTTLGSQFMDAGFTTGYCLEDMCGGLCDGPNPPRWCQYARGEYFLYPEREAFASFGDFALCTIDGPCPEECVTPGPGPIPPICPVIDPGNVDALPGLRIDVFQYTMVRQFDRDYFPIGIPVWWSVVDTDVIVTGAFMHAETGLRAEAIEFIYAATALDAQTLLAESGLLPANGSAITANLDLLQETFADNETVTGLLNGELSLGPDERVAGGVVVDF